MNAHAQKGRQDVRVDSSAARSRGDSVLGHEPEVVTYDGETWKIICGCAWECWNVEDEEVAWEAFNDHVFDDVNTALRRLRGRTVVARV